MFCNPSQRIHVQFLEQDFGKQIVGKKVSLKVFIIPISVTSLSLLKGTPSICISNLISYFKKNMMIFRSWHFEEQVMIFNL